MSQMAMLSNAGEFNTLFVESTFHGGTDDIHKTAESIGDYIQLKIREQGFARQILEFGTVTNRDPQMQRVFGDAETDTLEYVVPIEPDTVAMRINMRADPENVWVPGNRFSIRFQTISTKKFNKTEQELLAHTEPFLKIIEQNSLKDLQEVEDISFLDHVRSSAFAASWRLNQQDRLAGGLTGFLAGEGALVDLFFKGDAVNPPIANPLNSNIIMSTDSYFRRDTIADLAKCLDNRQLNLKIVLMHKSDWEDTLTWEADEIGHEVASRITIDGYKERTVGGYTFITTLRTNNRLVRPGHFYGFTDKSALGKFLQFEAPKWYIEKRGHKLHMYGWEFVGMGIGNVNGCALLMLSGSPTLDIAVGTQVYATGIVRLYPDGVDRAAGNDPDE